MKLVRLYIHSLVKLLMFDWKRDHRLCRFEEYGIDGKLLHYGEYCMCGYGKEEP